MKKRYKIKKGASLPVKAVVAAKEVNNVVLECKGIGVAENLVRRSKSKLAPLHECFEWNNTKAAHKYRLEQARYVIGAIEVVYVDENGQASPPSRAFVNIITESTHKPRVCIGIERVLSDKELKKQYLQQLLAEYVTLYDRNKTVKEFAKIHREIKQAKKRLG